MVTGSRSRFTLPSVVITAMVILLTIIYKTECSEPSEPTSLCTEGWIGPNCNFRCRCSERWRCRNHSGDCRCERGFMGPYCQYTSAILTAPAEQLKWLTDHDDSTCNNDQRKKNVDVSLKTPIPLTWVRVTVRRPNLLSLVQVSFKQQQQQQSSLASLEPCWEHRATINDVTLEIWCRTAKPVTAIRITGAAVKDLCSVHVNAGRNVALKQNATQFNTFMTWRAQHAVDGNIPAPNSKVKVLGQFCSHTETAPTGKRNWWAVRFRRPVKPVKFVVYNRREFYRTDCCDNRLIGFTLDAFPVSTPRKYVFRHDDTESTFLPIYTIVPPRAISQPINRVRILSGTHSTLMSLCEVQVFGEVICPTSHFGLECEKKCNCAEAGKAEDGRDCFVTTGACPTGCADGYRGLDCYEPCDTRFYGASCSQTCDINCAGGARDCHHITGECTHGCSMGYQPPMCHDQCAEGTFGFGCKNCSQNCVPENGTEFVSCNYITGECALGCKPGYWMKDCFEACPRGTFGQDCTEVCSKSCLHGECDSVTGRCKHCEWGLIGTECTTKCPKTFWGFNCTQSCRSECKNNECNNVDGQCLECPEGKLMPDCLVSLEQKSEDETWDPSKAIESLIPFALLGFVLLPMGFYYFLAGGAEIQGKRSNESSSDSSDDDTDSLSVSDYQLSSDFFDDASPSASSILSEYSSPAGGGLSYIGSGHKDSDLDGDIYNYPYGEVDPDIF